MVGDVDRLEAESLLRQEPVEPGLLECGIVIGRQVVDAEHGDAARQQRLSDMVTDEAGRAGEQDAAG